MANRKRVRVAVAMPIGSSDYKGLKTKREILKSNHEDRVKAINLMSFSTDEKKKMNSLRNHAKSYTKVFGNIVYAEEAIILGAGMSLYWM